MTFKHPDTPQALELYQALSAGFLQKEFGHLITKTQNVVRIPNNPEASEEVQRSLTELVKRMATVYLFSIFDEYCTKEMEKRMDPDELIRLKAFRHIRNSAAHGKLFERAPNCKRRQQFEDVMNSGSPIHGVVFDNTRLELTKSSVEMDCYNFMSNLAQQLIARLENNP